MTKKHKTVLIGMGKMGRNHFRVLTEDSRFEVVAVVDPIISESALEKAPSIKLLRNIEQIDSVSWDCVVVAAPTEQHFPIAQFLLTKRKPILLEKPLASTPEQSTALLEKAKATGTKLAVGHLERFNPAVRKLKDLLDSKWIGQPIHFSITRVGGYPNQVNPGNNVLLDLAVHDLDVLNFLVGPMEVRSSICHSTWKEGVFDTAEILATNATGISASLHVNWVTPTKIRTLRVTGTQGVCFVDYMLQTVTMLGGNLLRKNPTADFDFDRLVEEYKATDKVEFGVVKEEPLRVQLTEFHRLINDEPSLICKAEDAELAVRLAHEAVRRSSEGVHTAG